MKGEWVPEGEESCRASIGKKIVTVWLPQGAKVRCRIGIRNLDNPMAGTYYHHYGLRSGFRHRIVIKLSEKGIT